MLTKQQIQVHALFTVCIVGLLPLRVEACPVCMALPTKTAADEVTLSETIVFAREDPDHPFCFTAVELLKGDAVVGDIDLFVDSYTRRQLKANPSYVVVLARTTGGAPWQSIGVADADFKTVIRRIVTFADGWAVASGPNKRYEFFLPLLGHKNPAIFELAYLELGRAPYSVIKKIASFVSRDELRPLLHQREYIKWRSLAILLLAQDASAADRDLIVDSFNGCQRFGSATNLSAWSTAYIEVDEVQAVQAIEDKYLRDPKRTEAEIRAVITALSVHGRSGHTHLRDRITRGYGAALANHPVVAGQIAKDLRDWQKWEYQEDINQLLSRPNIKFEMLEEKAIESYLRSKTLRTIGIERE